MKAKLEQGIKNIYGLSVGLHIPINISAPFIVNQCYKNIMALSLIINTEKNNKKEESKKKEEKPPEEEDDDIDLEGLF